MGRYHEIYIFSESFCIFQVQSGDLVRSADEVQIVAVEELADHVGSEGEGDAAIVLSPALNVFIRVGPQQVAQQPCRSEQREIFSLCTTVETFRNMNCDFKHRELFRKKKKKKGNHWQIARL